MKWWKVFLHLFEMCIVSAMALFLFKNPKFARKTNVHNRFQEVLVHEMVQPCLDYKADTAAVKEGRPSQSSQQLTVKICDDVRVVGKHYASKNELRPKYCMCAYKINSVTRKRNNKCSNNYCQKCQKYICEACFQDFHTKSSM